jgi:hypothetical protein
MKETIYIDLRYSNKKTFENDNTGKILENDGWEEYKTVTSKELNMFTRHYKKVVEN